LTDCKRPGEQNQGNYFFYDFMHEIAYASSEDSHSL